VSEDVSAPDGERKTCFVICPIGDDNSPVRQHSDRVLRYIISPAVTTCGYAEPERSDRMPRPGDITPQIIERLLNDTLVIADLTERNPNVYYELAVRHAARKPVILIRKQGESIPFDVYQSRAISFDLSIPESIEACITNMKQQIRAVEEDHTSLFNPISTAVDLLGMRGSANPLLQSQAEMMTTLENMSAALQAALQVKHLAMSVGEYNSLFASLTGARKSLREAVASGADITLMKWVDRILSNVESQLFWFTQQLNLRLTAPDLINDRLLPDWPTN
jgi:hypothetical protein